MTVKCELCKSKIPADTSFFQLAVPREQNPAENHIRRQITVCDTCIQFARAYHHEGVVYVTAPKEQVVRLKKETPKEG